MNIVKFVALTAVAMCCSLSHAQQLHVVYAIDTNSNLRQSVLSDLGNMQRTIRGGLPKHKLGQEIVIQGGQMTAQNVATTLGQLQIQPKDSVLFYYSGHGAFVPGRGHVLTLSNGDDLFRSSIEHAMTNPMKPRFWAIITDCCSSFVNVRPGVAPAPAPNTTLLTNLFFGRPGRVDITSSRPGQVSYGPDSGGLFTTALCRTLQDNANQRLEWSDVFSLSREETAAVAENGLQNERGPHQNAGFDQRTQIPYSFKTMIGKEVNGWRLGSYYDDQLKVTRVVPNTPAAQSGIRRGMRITGFNGEVVRNEKEFLAALYNSPQNAVLSINGRPVNVRLAY